MKHFILSAVLISLAGSLAQASSQNVTGAKAIKAIEGSFLSSGPFVGNNDASKNSEECQVSLVRRGQDLEVKVELNGHWVQSLSFAVDASYRGTKKQSSDGSYIISLESSTQVLSITQVNDAYSNVTTQTSDLTVSCEVDM